MCSRLVVLSRQYIALTTAVLAGASHFYPAVEIAPFPAQTMAPSRRLSRIGFASTESFGKPEHPGDGFSVTDRAREDHLDR